MRRLVKDIALALYWYPLRMLAWVLPLSALYAFGRLCATVLYHIACGRRDRLGREYDLLPGALSMTRKQAVKGAITHLCLVEFEVLIYDRLSPSNIAQAVEVEGLDLLDAALDEGKGAMLVFGHFGANQMVMPAIGHRGYRMCQLSAPATVWEGVMPEVSFSQMQKRSMRLRWKQESSLPVTHINIFGSLKEAFKCLKRNEVLGVAIDGGGGAERMEMDFLGRRALISAGPFDIALRTGCAVLPVFMTREPSGRNRMVIHPQMSTLKRADQQADVGAALREYLLLFEGYVIKYPDMYLNFLALRSFMAMRGDTPYFIGAAK